MVELGHYKFVVGVLRVGPGCRWTRHALGQRSGDCGFTSPSVELGGIAQIGWLRGERCGKWSVPMSRKPMATGTSVRLVEGTPFDYRRHRTRASDQGYSQATHSARGPGTKHGTPWLRDFPQYILSALFHWARPQPQLYPAFTAGAAPIRHKPNGSSPKRPIDSFDPFNRNIWYVAKG
jgi:hypothetical protein